MHEEILGQLDLRLFKSTYEKKSPFPKTRKDYVASLAHKLYLFLVFIFIFWIFSLNFH